MFDVGGYMREIRVRVIPIMVLEEDGQDPLFSLDGRIASLFTAVADNYDSVAEREEIDPGTLRALAEIEANKEKLLPIPETRHLQAHLLRMSAGATAWNEGQEEKKEDGIKW